MGLHKMVNTAITVVPSLAHVKHIISYILLVWTKIETFCRLLVLQRSKDVSQLRPEVCQRYVHDVPSPAGLSS